MSDIDIMRIACNELSIWEINYPVMPYWRFYWNSCPGAQIHCNGKKHLLQPDCFYIIPPYTKYTTALNNPTVHLNCNFDINNDWLKLPAGVYNVQPPGNEIDKAKTLLQLFAEDENDLHEFGKQILMMQLICYCFTQLPVEYPQERSVDPRIEKTLQYIGYVIKESSASPLDNAHLASIAKLHPSSYLRMFQHYMKKSPQQYIRSCKMEKACRLLHNSMLSIDEIAIQLGYCDRYHFSREFKKNQSLSPVAFRKNLGSNIA